jgi:hypothetical protein
VKAAVLLGLGDPLFGIMMESDCVDKRACWASSHAVQARFHNALRVLQTSEFEVSTYPAIVASSLDSPRTVDGTWCGIEIKVTLGSERLGIERSGFWQNAGRGVAGEDGYAIARSNGTTIAMLSDNWLQASRDAHPRHDHHNITATWLGMLGRPENVQLMASLRTL